MRSTRAEADRKRRLILDLHEQGLSSSEISRKTGIGITLVCKRLKEAGFGRRDDFYVCMPKPICEKCDYPDCVWDEHSSKCKFEKKLLKMKEKVERGIII